MDTAYRQGTHVIGHYPDGRPIFSVSGGDGDDDKGGAGGDGDKAPPGDDDKGGAGGDGDKTFHPITTQEQYDRVAAGIRRDATSKYGDYDDLKKKASKFDELTESQKSDLQKATDQSAADKDRADAAELKALRLEVAFEKELTPGQAKRLVGKTRGELEADADDLLSELKPAEDNKKGGPTRRTRERLGGGTEPDDNDDGETDPRKLAQQVPRV